MEHVYDPARDPLLQIALCDAAMFRPAFFDWLRDTRNRHFWIRFKAEADRIWNRGRRHYSARTIIEFLRHETLAADACAEFKINGNIVPDLARLYLLVHPERAGFFELRVQQDAERAA